MKQFITYWKEFQNYVENDNELARWKKLGYTEEQYTEYLCNLSESIEDVREFFMFLKIKGYIK